jgi:hypothetical protein
MRIPFRKITEFKPVVTISRLEPGGMPATSPHGSRQNGISVIRPFNMRMVSVRVESRLKPDIMVSLAVFKTLRSDRSDG